MIGIHNYCAFVIIIMKQNYILSTKIFHEIASGIKAMMKSMTMHD